MAISANAQRKFGIGIVSQDAAENVCDAVDANTLSTAKVALAAAVDVTTANATTTWLHTTVQSIVSALT